MSGLVPDPIAGAVVVTDASGASVNQPPQAGLFDNYGTSFTVTGGLSYLQLPVVGGSCGGRVTQMQVNFIVSELFALAAALDPSFTWNPANGSNIAAAFAVFKQQSATTSLPSQFILDANNFDPNA